MSSLYQEYGSERVTEKESLLVRQELEEVFGKENLLQISIEKDFYGNKNIFLVNPIEEKLDNGDIDCFLFYDKNHKISYSQIVNILQGNSQFLMYKKNDKIHSVLFFSKIIDKKVQIDIHILENTRQNILHYFNYYRVPYFNYLIGIILKEINLKWNTKGLFYRLKDTIYFEKENEYLNIKEDILLSTDPYFILKEVFGIVKEDFKNISSYKSIVEYIYFIFGNISISSSVNKYKKALNSNEKVSYMLKLFSEMSDGSDSLESISQGVYTVLERKFNIKNKIKKIKDKVIQKRENKRKRNEDLIQLYNVSSLDNLSLEKKKTIKYYSNYISDLLDIKSINNILNNYFNDNRSIYIVGGKVRDILLGKKSNDYDITGEYLPDEFHEVFGGTITEKYGTVFITYNNLEIEYTPFRIEEDYKDRKPQNTSFNNVSIEEDAKRRDFTINSIYLRIKDLEIIDIYGGVDDLNKGIIKSVGNSVDRFSEDPLRILRGLRLASKFQFFIEENTYTGMINLSRLIKTLPIERVCEEYFKGFSLPDEAGKAYLRYIDIYYKETGLYPDVMENYKKSRGKIFGVILYLCNNDLYLFRKIPNSGNNKSLISYILQKELYKTNFANFEMKDMVRFVFQLGKRGEKFNIKSLFQYILIIKDIYNILDDNEESNINNYIGFLLEKDIPRTKREFILYKGYNIQEIINKIGTNNLQSFLLEEYCNEFFN